MPPESLTDRLQEAFKLAEEREAIAAELEQERIRFEAALAKVHRVYKKRVADKAARYEELSKAIASLGSDLAAVSTTVRTDRDEHSSRPPQRRRKTATGDVADTGKVLVALKRIERGNARVIGDEIGADTSSVALALSALKEQGKVRAIGQGRYRDYEPI